MNKIPVGKTIAFAYRFAFGGIGTVIGLIWLPLIISFVGEFFALTYFSQLADEIVTDTNPLAYSRLLVLELAFFFLSVLLIALIAGPLTRQALGQTKTAARIGLGEFYLFMSFLAVFFVMMVMFLVLTLASTLLGAAAAAIVHASGASAIAGQLIAILAGLALLLGLLYIATRLTFLVAPVAVAESKVDLIRAWSLTRGNFLRIFAVGVSIFVPLLLIYVVTEAIILGPQAFVPKPAAADPAGQLRQMAEQLHQILPHLPVLTGIGLLFAPFSYALIFAAPAFAYRNLTTSAPPTPPDMGPLRPA